MIGSAQKHSSNIGERHTYAAHDQRSSRFAGAWAAEATPIGCFRPKINSLEKCDECGFRLLNQ
jgi:hypothetical protein